jgi:ADP-ribose pyrophosphatase YjhB (NUDIX family)
MSGQFPNTFYRVSVKGLVLDGEGNPLVIQEQQDAWSLPGGGLDHGEKPQDALEREFREELGVRVKIGEIATVRTFMHPNGQVWLMWLVYGVELQDQNFALGQGVDRAEFVPISELSDDDPFEAMVKDVCQSVSN